MPVKKKTTKRKDDKLKSMLGTSVERIKEREAHKLEKKE